MQDWIISQLKQTKLANLIKTYEIIKSLRKTNEPSTDLHFNSDGVQSSEVERRIPQQNIERTSGRVAFPQRFPVYAHVHRCDLSLGEGQDSVEKQEN